MGVVITRKVSISGGQVLRSANNLGDVVSAATAFNNIKQAASTSATGVVELPTVSEALAGSSTTLGMTPETTKAVVDRVLASMQGASYLLSDGNATRREIETIYGALGAIAGSGYSEVRYIFDVPTTAPSGGAYIAVWTSGSNIVTAHSLQILITGNELRIQEFGATSGDYRLLTFSGWRTTYSGRRVALDIAFEGNSTTAPVVYQDGVALTGGSVSTAGDAPNWVHTALATTYHRRGFNWPGGGYFRPGSPINRKYAQADVDFVQRTGRLPASDAFGGSAVGKVTGDDSTGATDTGFWSKLGTTPPTISGGFNFTGNGRIERASFIKINERYRLFVSASSLTTGPLLYWDGTAYQTALASAGSVEIEFVSKGTGSWALNLLDGSATVTAVRLTWVGGLSDSNIQPGCPVLTDSTINSIPSVAVGFSAIGSRPEVVAIPIPSMTADGFVYLDGVITPSGYELFAATIERTSGASTGTVTIRETSSGGTTLASGALGATPTAMAISNAYSGAGKKLHIANSSWSSSTLKGRLLFRRYQ